MSTRTFQRTRATALALIALVVAAGCTTTTPSASPASPSQPGPTPSTNAERCAELTAAARANPPHFDPATTWNRPAACLPAHPESARWARTWFESANFPGRSDPAKRGAITVAFDEYSSPVYDVADATTVVRVYTTSWGYGHNLGEHRELPWNPSWEPARGNDHELIIIDPATGREWGLWGVMKENWTTCLTMENLLAGFRPGVDLCVAKAALGIDVSGQVSDYRASSGHSLGFGRGFGRVQSLALLPRLHEVEAGSIHHALNMETYATMFGPACTPGQMGTAAAGRDCGFAVAPATRIEWIDGPPTICGVRNHPNTPEARSRTVPGGMRFVHDLTDAEIDQWLDRRGLTGAKRRTARIFAVALRDYGWIISDTTCWGSSVAVEGVANPKAADRWRDLGIAAPQEDGPTLLEGLIPDASRVRVVAPPSAEAILTHS